MNSAVKTLSVKSPAPRQFKPSNYLLIVVKLILLLSLFVPTDGQDLSVVSLDSNDGANTELPVPSRSSPEGDSSSSSAAPIAVPPTAKVTTFLDENHEPRTTPTDPATPKPPSKESESAITKPSSSIPSHFISPKPMVSSEISPETSSETSSKTSYETSSETSSETSLETSSETSESSTKPAKSRPKPTPDSPPKYVRQNAVPPESIFSVELKAEFFDVQEWVLEKSSIFSETIISQTASKLQLEADKTELFFVHPTPMIYSERTIVRFSLKTNKGFMEASKLEKIEGDITKALQERMNVKIASLWAGTDQNHNGEKLSMCMFSIALISMVAVSSVLTVGTTVMVTLIYCRKDSGKSVKTAPHREGAPEFDTIKPSPLYQGNVNNGFEISSGEFPTPTVARTAGSFMEGSVVPFSERFYAEPNRINDSYVQINTMDTRL